MSFATMLNHTITIVHDEPSEDIGGGPIANWVTDETDVPARVQDHATKLLGNEVPIGDNMVIVSERDVFVAGLKSYLGPNGNGYAVQFDDGTFARVSDLKRNRTIGNMPDHTKIICKVIGS